MTFSRRIVVIVQSERLEPAQPQLIRLCLSILNPQAGTKKAPSRFVEIFKETSKVSNVSQFAELKRTCTSSKCLQPLHSVMFPSQVEVSFCVNANLVTKNLERHPVIELRYLMTGNRGEL